MPEGNTEVAYRTVHYGDIEVCWLMSLEGGGRTFGQSFLPVIEHLFGRVDRVFELCAGAGCIGFSLLANGFCNSLALGDINPAAVAAARETVRRNGLEDRVTVYHSDGLADVPEEESCDLFVVNPPFFSDEQVPFMRENPWIMPGTELRAEDRGLRLHRTLYGEIARFLRPGGSVLFQDTSLAAPPEAFLPMIEAGGLEHIRTIWYTENRRVPGLYFMWSKAASPAMLVDPVKSGPVRVELRDPPGEPLALATQAIHMLRLCNLSDRPVSVKADLTGRSIPNLEWGFVEIPVDGELDLPYVSLGPDRRVVFRDERSGSTLATVFGSEE
jgi:SAM-dependent methyltransferase